MWGGVKRSAANNRRAEPVRWIFRPGATTQNHDMFVTLDVVGLPQIFYAFTKNNIKSGRYLSPGL